MPQYNKTQLLTLKSNIDQYLKKEEEKENITYRKLAEAFSSSRATLDQILSRIENGAGYERFATALKALKNDLGSAINTTRPDLTGIVSTLKDFQKQVNSVLIEQKKTDQTIIEYLTTLSKALSKKPEKAKDRTDEIIEALNNIKVQVPEIEFPTSVEVSNFPPQKVANPVTHISINSLNGYIKTTAVTVTTALTTLPSYGVLSDRRTIEIFNNSSSITVYIGGSDVTSSNGLPILAQTYSPPIDAGPTTILYGLTSSSSADVRVIEISDEHSGR